ncbi:MAG: DUF4062 domain-containing protein [Burkholderiales bacterium]
MRIFLSAVSSQFKTCREQIASDLRARGCEVRVQEDFQQGPRTLLEQLEKYIAECDRVIALIGDARGAMAEGVPPSLVCEPCSYTQWEYIFAIGERLNGQRIEQKDLFVYVAADPYLQAHPVEQSQEAAVQQRRFVEQIKSSGKHRTPFDTLDQVCRWVLRDGWNENERPLPPTDPAALNALDRVRTLLANGAEQLSLDKPTTEAILRHTTQVLPVACGVPWLGFIVFPTHRRVKARKVRLTTHHLQDRLDAYEAGAITFAELSASVQGWINHVRYADTWGLRKHVLSKLRLKMHRPSHTTADQ